MPVTRARRHDKAEKRSSDADAASTATKSLEPSSTMSGSIDKFFSRKALKSDDRNDEQAKSIDVMDPSTPPICQAVDLEDKETVQRAAKSESGTDSLPPVASEVAEQPPNKAAVVTPIGSCSGIELDFSNEETSVGGEDEDDPAGDEDWAAEEKQLREANRRRLEEERRKAKKLSSREKVQLLDNLLQKAAAYSAFLRGRMEEAVSLQVNERVSGADVTRDPRQPSLVTGAVMRKYQVEGVLWMASLYENGLNGILADEMGLGKTLQTIAFLAHLYEMKVYGPFLILAPLSTIQNWNREFHRFAPTIPTVVYHGTKDERKELREKIVQRKGQEWPVVITSFEVAMNDSKILSRLPRGGSWKYLVVDEGHRLKNKDCRLLRELKTLPTDNRLLLSGTPLQNNLSELWSLLNFILPQIFTDLSTFQNWFDFEEDLHGDGASERIVAEEQENKTISKLHTILDPFLLRRLKSDVELCLPDKREYIVYVPWSETQLRINQAIAERKLQELCDSECSSGFKPDSDGSWNNSECISNVNDKATSLQNIMMQMRKCCNHPYLFQAPKDPAGNIVVDERLITSSGKLSLLDKMLPILKTSGHKVLIFCQMTIMMDLLEDYMEFRGMNYERIDGTVGWKERQERMDNFNGNKDSFVFLLSTRAGGIGINLVAADTVIFYDSDWNPQQDLQAQDRCHRIGQTKPVLVLRLLTVDSIESHIYDRACGKRKLELVAIARKRFKVADKVQHGAKIEDLEAAGKDKRGFVAQVRESMTADELTELLRRRSVGGAAKEAVISDAHLGTLLLVRSRAEGLPNEGPGWVCVTED